MRRAGLTDQSGHGASEFFLLFYREREALTRRNVVSIGEANYVVDGRAEAVGRFFVPGRL